MSEVAATPAEDQPSAAQRRRWLSRSAAVAGVLILVLVVAGAAALLALRSERAESRATIAGLEQELGAAREEIANAERQIAAMSGDLTEARAEAREEYLRGLREGRERENAFRKSAGLTYDAGFRDGYEDAFCCFDGGWEPDEWYLVKIGSYEDRPRLKYEIESRFDAIEPCELFYLSNDSLYTRGYGC